MNGFLLTRDLLSIPILSILLLKKVREKSRECHNHKPQPFLDPKTKRKPTNLNKHKPNKRTKSTKISSLFPKRGNRNTKRTEKHKNKMTHGKTYNKSPRRINHKATRSKTNTGTTALERLKFAVSIEEKQDRLPTLYWLPKLHKRPYKVRFIANSRSCTTTVLSKLLTSCLTAVKKHWIRYYDTVYERDGINYFGQLKILMMFSISLNLKTFRLLNCLHMIFLLCILH